MMYNPDKLKTIEIIIPCYNEEACISLIYAEICAVFCKIKTYDFHIIFVDDGSRDGTLIEIKKVYQNAAGKVDFVSLARNFGKESAIYAGLSQCRGEYAILMDADLQHPPALIPQMILALEEGYDCCAAKRISRKGEGIIRSACANGFYAIMNRVCGIALVPGATDYRMMKKEVVSAILSLEERERFTKGVYSWIGFKTKWIGYENVERAAGITKWSFRGLIKYALNGFMAYATTPLRGAVYLGMFVTVMAFIYAVYIFVSAWENQGERTGWASLLIIMLFLGGIIISLLGVIGEYLARIYLEVKKRPLFIARENSLKQTKETDNEK